MKKMAALVLLAGMACAHAQVTYTYTGQNFSAFPYPNAVFSKADKVSFSLTFAEALPASSYGISYNSKLTDSQSLDNAPLSWQVNAGVIGSADISSLYFMLSTDASGAINDWKVVFQKDILGYYAPGTIFDGVDAYVESNWRSVSDGLSGADIAATCQGNSACLNEHSYPVATSSQSGAWQISAVPEPDTRTTLAYGIGVLLFGGHLSRRVRRHVVQKL